MKIFRLSIILSLLICFTFAEHRRGKYKRIKHNKKHSIKVIHKHKQPRFRINLGHNYFWHNWAFGHRRCNKIHSNDVIFINKKIDYKNDGENFDMILSNIEKLAILKEKGLISEKEYEKKKKDLLRKI